MTDHEYTKSLSRELDEERAAHAATKADLDTVRAALEKAEGDLAAARARVAEVVRELNEARDALRVQNDLALERLAAVQKAEEEREAFAESRERWMIWCQEKSNDKADALQAIAAKDERIAVLEGACHTLVEKWIQAAREELSEPHPIDLIAGAYKVCADDLRALLDSSPAQTPEAKP